MVIHFDVDTSPISPNDRRYGSTYLLQVAGITICHSGL